MVMVELQTRGTAEHSALRGASSCPLHPARSCTIGDQGPRESPRGQVGHGGSSHGGTKIRQNLHLAQLPLRMAFTGSGVQDPTLSPTLTLGTLWSLLGTEHCSRFVLLFTRKLMLSFTPSAWWRDRGTAGVSPAQGHTLRRFLTSSNPGTGTESQLRLVPGSPMAPTTAVDTSLLPEMPNGGQLGATTPG